MLSYTIIVIPASLEAEGVEGLKCGNPEKDEAKLLHMDPRRLTRFHLAKARRGG